MVPFRAVLFDLFDTLCHIDEALYLHGKELSARELGEDADRYLRAWLSLQDRCQRGEVASLADWIRETCGLLGRRIGAEQVQKLRRHEEEVLFRSVSLHPDVLPILRRMRSIPGFGMALVSNASASARPLLDVLGLGPFFDATILSFEVGSVKPEPEIYLAACRSLSVSASRCLFVGDGNGRELEGAMALGMTAVRIERPLVMEAYRNRPSLRWDFSVRDLRDLPDLPWDRQSHAGASIS